MKRKIDSLEKEKKSLNQICDDLEQMNKPRPSKHTPKHKHSNSMKEHREKE